jgi:hypothetical protein
VDTDLDEVGAEATDDAAQPPAIASAWPLWQRIAFRYVLLHYVLYGFPGPLGHLLNTISGAFQVVGLDVKSSPWSWPGWAAEAVDKAWQPLTDWMAAHGLAPYEVIHQPTGSGDTGHAFAQLLAIVALSLAGAALWSLLADLHHGYPRLGHPRLGRWLHLVVRFDLAFTMLGYGTSKFYGGQFGELTLDRLTQEIGDTWPMTMVGTFMQASPPYEWFGGAGEVLGGLLLFHRRTALLGAFVSIGVLTNVCALNWLCGVPVKQYSLHLLLYAIGLLAPFAPRLWATFVSNGSAPPVDLRVVQSARAGRWLTALGTIWVVGTLLVTHLTPRPWLQTYVKPPLHGLWTVESMLLDGHEVPVTDALRWRDFAIERGTVAWSREATGRRHRFEFRLDAAGGSAQVKELGSGSAEAAKWTCELGRKVVKVDPPLLLHNEDRGKKVDGERRTLVLEGQWGEHRLELHTVEKQFRLQTGFRLRQELPDFW